MAHHALLRITAWFLALLLLTGCGGAPSPKEDATARQPNSKSAKAQTKPRAAGSKAARPPHEAVKPKVPEPTEKPKPPAPEETTRPKSKPRRENSLSSLLSGDPTAWSEPSEPEPDPHDAVGRMVPNLPRMKIDASKVRAAGIRRLEGKHLTLYTDLPSDAEVDTLPAVFDAAFPAWCAYFGLQPSEHADWRLVGVLMKDKARFTRAGLLPADLPTFPHGYARNYEFWMYEQPSAYYRRHLLLHEGTHGFMNTLLGSCGPPWYMEGIAELLATHRWSEGRLETSFFPATREEVPMWGRIKIVRDAFAAYEGKQLNDVVHYSSRAHRDNEPYGWCWAAAAFLDRHPRYRERFRKLSRLVTERDFSKRFYEMFSDDWKKLCEEWELYVAGLEYGYDIPRMAVEFSPGSPLPASGAEVAVAADRGWQSSGVELEKGKTYRLTASGRYQVADRPQIWWCEPGGVSIRYVKGRPLGILLAAVRSEEYGRGQSSAMLRPIVVGLGTTLLPHHTGTLYLRINDSPSALADNAGTLSVRIETEKATAAD